MPSIPPSPDRPTTLPASSSEPPYPMARSKSTTICSKADGAPFRTASNRSFAKASWRSWALRSIASSGVSLASGRPAETVNAAESAGRSPSNSENSGNCRRVLTVIPEALFCTSDSPLCFLSGTVRKKMGLTVTSTKGEDGQRSYSVDA